MPRTEVFVQRAIDRELRDAPTSPAATRTCSRSSRVRHRASGSAARMDRARPRREPADGHGRARDAEAATPRRRRRSARPGPRHGPGGTARAGRRQGGRSEEAVRRSCRPCSRSSSERLGWTRGSIKARGRSRHRAPRGLPVTGGRPGPFDVGGGSLGHRIHDRAGHRGRERDRPGHRGRPGEARASGSRWSGATRRSWKQTRDAGRPAATR